MGGILINSIGIGLAVVGIGLSVTLLVCYWQDRKWALGAPPSVYTLAESAVQRELFRLGKQVLVLVLMILALLATVIDADPHPTVDALRDGGAVVRIILVIAFITTSINDLRLRRRAQDQYLAEQNISAEAIEE